MESLDDDALRDALERYDRHAAFAGVEDDRLDTMPAAFRNGTYLWKDVEWVVRWYCRRPHADRSRDAESAFRDNEMTAIEQAIDGVFDAEDMRTRVTELTSLDGVDVPIATAFLQFIDPESFAAIDRTGWDALTSVTGFDDPYPDPVTVTAYDRFMRECHGIAATTGTSVVDAVRALQVLEWEGRAANAGRHR